MGKDKYIESYEIEHTDLPIRVYFVRHGQPDRSTDDAEFGPCLTSLGQRQAKRVAKRLSDVAFEHIYSSDLARAHETATIIAENHPDVPITVSDDLREVVSHHFVPDMNGIRPMTQLAIAQEQDHLTRFANRVRHSHHSGDRILVVCHGNFIRTIMPMLGGRNPKECLLIDLYHTSVSILEVWDSGEVILKTANSVDHLLPRQVT